jgi:preprotein translocase subunit SecF
MKIFSRVISAISIIFFISSCFSLRYDFKGGATIDPKIETLSVQFFNNRATRVNPTLSQSFTDALKAYMESNTSLRVINTMGNVDFSGEINKYEISSVGVVSGDLAAKTRFTISIRVKFTNSVNPKNNFDTSFSSFRDFPSTQTFSSVEDEFSKDIINEIIDQIFNKAFVNW